MAKNPYEPPIATPEEMQTYTESLDAKPVAEEAKPITPPTVKAPAKPDVDDSVSDDPFADMQVGIDDPDYVESVKQPEDKKVEVIEEKVTENKESRDDALFDEKETTVEEKHLLEPRQVKVPETHVVDPTGDKPLKFTIKPTKDFDRITDKVIYTLRGTAQSVMSVLQRTDSSFIDNDEKQRWYEAVVRAREHFQVRDDQLFEATIRDGSMWVNMVGYGEGENVKWRGPLVDRKGRNPQNKNDKNFTAVNMLKSFLSLGLPAYIPLYHTGIWLTLNTPTAQEFAILDEIIMNSKVTYGRMTRGEIYSNDSVVLRKHIADFILDHVQYSTAPADDKEYLKSIIKSTDLDAMMLGIMMSRFPDGYPINIPCTVNPQECIHVTEGEVDLRKLFWVDRNRLTERQLTLMQSPTNRLTSEQLEEYQNEFNFANKRIVLSKDANGALRVSNDTDIANGVIINLDTPTLEHEENYGTQWINELQRSAEKVFAESNDQNARDQKIRERIMTSFFKTYGQWIKSVELITANQTEQIFTEEDNLDQILMLLSSDATYTRYFHENIMKYINSSLVQLVGVKNFECPNCGKKHDTAPGGHYLILPIDAINTFFLFVQSVVRLATLEPAT